LELSEVNLSMSEAQKIGAALVALVREKSHRVLAPLPSTKEELRAAKGLVLDDVLRTLSLSAAGYRELKSTGRPAVVALSRLHRLCKRCNVPDHTIPELCHLKSAWDAWWVVQRHLVSKLDYTALKTECCAAIQSHSAGTLDFDGLRAEAKSLAVKYRPALTSTQPLNDELVFGLMMTAVAEAEQ
jgi:DNA-binding Xre family transcriptional regulator